MKYANQINLAMVVVAVVILAYAFSSTYLAEYSTASFQASLPPASSEPVELDAQSEREPEVSNTPSGRTSVPTANRADRNRPRPAEDPDAPQETGEEMVQSPQPAGGDIGESGLLGATSSPAARSPGSGFTRPPARNTPNRPATTNRRPVPAQNQRGIMAGARSEQPQATGQQPTEGDSSGVQPPPSQQPPTPPPATPPAAGNRRQSPPPPPTRSSVPNR